MSRATADWLEVLADQHRAGLVPPGGILLAEPPPRENMVHRPPWSAIRMLRGNAPYPPRRICRLIANWLRARPNLWALIYIGLQERAKALYTEIRTGLHWWRPDPPGLFETVTRQHDGEVAVYTRYVELDEGGDAA